MGYSALRCRFVCSRVGVQAARRALVITRLRVQAPIWRQQRSGDTTAGAIWGSQGSGGPQAVGSVAFMGVTGRWWHHEGGLIGIYGGRRDMVT